VVDAGRIAELLDLAFQPHDLAQARPTAFRHCIIVAFPLYRLQQRRFGVQTRNPPGKIDGPQGPFFVIWNL
ncbi:MAG: hypothetical protein KDE06_00315, partial [Rhodobacteraceae bacterium]|nr:hypothetical protein [Paracoccaceae bacterium]